MDFLNIGATGHMVCHRANLPEIDNKNNTAYFDLEQGGIYNIHFQTLNSPFLKSEISISKPSDSSSWISDAVGYINRIN
jgi:hypothetical protein